MEIHMFNRKLVPAEYRKLARRCSDAKEAAKNGEPVAAAALLRMAAASLENLPETPPLPRKAPAHLLKNHDADGASSTQKKPVKK
jgi:hypothetical protein